MNYQQYVFSSHELKSLIQHILLNGIDKCTNCEGTGWENWNEDGEDVKAGRSTQPGRCSGECEECSGTGFQLPNYDY